MQSTGRSREGRGALRPHRDRPSGRLENETGKRQGELLLRLTSTHASKNTKPASTVNKPIDQFLHHGNSLGLLLSDAFPLHPAIIDDATPHMLQQPLRRP